MKKLLAFLLGAMALVAQGPALLLATTALSISPSVFAQTGYDAQKDLAPGSPEALGKFLRDDIDTWRRVAQAAGVKPE